MPVILIGIAVTVFFVFTNPLYNDITAQRATAASYDEALSNSKALENERDVLTKKFNDINPDNLLRLQKLLPENIDNIRLILEIEKIASPYGMVLRDVKYSPTPAAAGVAGNATSITPQGGGVPPPPTDYGVWDLEFSTEGTYANFLNFTRDLESNLRIVDISSVQFSSASTSNPRTAGTSIDPTTEVYKYGFKIKTYWLKD